MIGQRTRHSFAQFLELQEPMISVVLLASTACSTFRSPERNCCTSC